MSNPYIIRVDILMTIMEASSKTSPWKLVELIGKRFLKQKGRKLLKFYVDNGLKIPSTNGAWK